MQKRGNSCHVRHGLGVSISFLFLKNDYMPALFIGITHKKKKIIIEIKNSVCERSPRIILIH